MELNLIKKHVKTTFKNPYEIGDNVRVEIPGLQKNQKENLVMKYIQLLKYVVNVLY